MFRSFQIFKKNVKKIDFFFIDLKRDFFQYLFSVQEVINNKDNYLLNQKDLNFFSISDLI